MYVHVYVEFSSTKDANMWDN